MISGMLQRSAASSWRQSSAKYGGRSWPLLVVMVSNLIATTLFGGSIMLFLVAATETVYAYVNPGTFTWFAPEAAQALVGYGAIAFLASVLPVLLTIGINHRYRRKCKSCGR